MNTTSAFYEVLEKYSHGDPELNSHLSSEMILYKNAKGDFVVSKISVFEHIHSKKRNRLEHQKLNDLAYVKKQNYDPIYVETLDDHEYFNWILEESPLLLTNDEINALRNDLANIIIQPISSNDIGELHLDDDEAQQNSMHDVNQNESNVGESSYFMPKFDDITLTPWAQIHYLLLTYCSCLQIIMFERVGYDRQIFFVCMAHKEKVASYYTYFLMTVVPLSCKSNGFRRLRIATTDTKDDNHLPLQQHHYNHHTLPYNHHTLPLLALVS
ncbi:hypothetical protein GmHk_06G016999 [Glycine max]|nr:hypothetical protein GmHk_06G016999 [Glycine max]